jgi:hypothetical protein
MPTFGTAPTSADGGSSGGSAVPVVSGSDVSVDPIAPESAPWGVIGGAIAGGIVLLALLAALFVVLSRHKKSKAAEQTNNSSTLFQGDDTAMAAFAAPSSMHRDVSSYAGLPVRPSLIGTAGAGGTGGGSADRTYGNVPDRLERDNMMSARDAPSEYRDLSISSGDTYQPLPDDPSTMGAAGCTGTAPTGVYAPAQSVDSYSN